MDLNPGGANAPQDDELQAERGGQAGGGQSTAQRKGLRTDDGRACTAGVDKYFASICRSIRIKKTFQQYQLDKGQCVPRDTHRVQAPREIFLCSFAPSPGKLDEKQYLLFSLEVTGPRTLKAASEAKATSMGITTCDIAAAADNWHYCKEAFNSRRRNGFVTNKQGKSKVQRNPRLSPSLQTSCR